jgi:pimeloyl-ACP methyl ester carboxylesterase
MKGWSDETLASIAALKPEFMNMTPLRTEYNKAASDTSQWIPFVTKMLDFEKTDFDLGIDNLRKTDKPVLIINGDYDGVKTEHSMELFREFGGGGTGIMAPTSDARWAIIPGTTHVTLMMQTRQLSDMIVAFLQP